MLWVMPLSVRLDVHMADPWIYALLAITIAGEEMVWSAWGAMRDGF